MTSAYGMAALAAETRKVRDSREGTRNVTLNGSAFKVFQLVAEGSIDRDEAITKLREAALSTGLPADEVDRTLRSAANGGMAHPQAPGRSDAEHARLGIAVVQERRSAGRVGNLAAAGITEADIS